ncbi:hypothetical protein AGABI2DRAFT_144085 [Agaricus bisporus var. bisporus H97]|uniref:hypothetical protein n=1 Tax=Agaricus bisporus var. bisporus (strain H97 / ATCC MYA-4626 / FGSC 10389) TaxID=936046 RepID=UPI00029F6E3E|nr:hypothetical protein AGABI2DRAFT_144085 [Agaricus bisporus var. bisporus H97]EKV45700.1 hypothetical protein AGABI2DRAFT_144085 [Agaricus bisporus var. bisporus H97]
MANPQDIINQLNAQHTLITQLQQQLAQLQNNPQPGPPGPQGPPGDDGETPIVQVVAPPIDVARPKIFSGDGKELSGFITACKIHLSLKMVGRLQGDQMTWILSYVQGGAAESWKENIMEMIENGEQEAPAYTEELFDSLRNNFGDADEESTAVGKLRLIEQGSKSAEEHVQEFKRIARDSGYEGRALIEEFKRSLSGRIRKALMESENPPTTIRSWYERSMKLDRQWRQAKAEEDYYRRGQAKPQLRTHTPNNTFVRPQPQRRDPNAMDVDTAAGPSRGWKLVSFPKKSSWGTVLQYRCEECGIQTSEHLLSKHKCPAKEEIALDEFGMPYEGSDDEEEGPTMAKIEAYEKEQEEIRDEEERYERVNKAVGRFTTPKNIIEGIALGVEAAFARELVLEPCQNVTASRFRRRLNYRHTAKMAQATDLPIELIDLILSFLPPNHAEQVQWRRAAAAVGREIRPIGWNLSDHRCRRCGRVCLAMWDEEERKAWIIQRWGFWGPRQWEIAGFFILCPCDAMLGNYFVYK